MGLIYRKVSIAEPVVDYLIDVLARELGAGRRVMWLVPGGSAIAVVAATSKQLIEKKIPLSNLAVTLTDERFGEVGHDDSNWRQLENAGFDLPGAKLHPVLLGNDMAKTVDMFEAFLRSELDSADFRFGLFGIGPDGHTSGILPHSSAVQEPRLAHGYDGGNYRRVTTTAAAISRLDEAVVYATGESKWQVLDQLESDLPVAEQPAQILKRVPKVTIFNDYK